MIKIVAGCIRNDDDSCCVGVNGYIDLNSIVQIIGSSQQISIFTSLDAPPTVVYWYSDLRDFMNDWMKLGYAIKNLSNKTVKHCGNGKYQIKKVSRIITTGDGYIGGFFYETDGGDILAFNDSFIKVNDILSVVSVSSNIINMIRIHIKNGCLGWVYDTEENMKNKIEEIREALEEQQEKND